MSLSSQVKIVISIHAISIFFFMWVVWHRFCGTSAHIFRSSTLFRNFFYHSLWHRGAAKKQEWEMNNETISCGTKEFGHKSRLLILLSISHLICVFTNRCDALNVESQNCKNEIYINFNICCEYSVIPIFGLYFCCCHVVAVGMSVRRACRRFTHSLSSLPWIAPP